MKSEKEIRKEIKKLESLLNKALEYEGYGYADWLQTKIKTLKWVLEKEVRK